MILTYEQLLEAFDRTDAKIAATIEAAKIAFEATKATFAAIADAQAKTDAQMARTDEQMARTEAQMARTDAQIAKSDAKLDRLAALYGGLSDNQGSVAEEFFFNSLRANPVIGNIRFDRVTPHLIVGTRAKQAEFDMVLVNGNAIAIVEIKHKAHLSALDQLDKQMHRYREVFPEHASYQLYGGIAALSVPEATVQAAHERGLFVLKQKGDVFTADAQAMRAF
jgi:hypothetical protein